MNEVNRKIKVSIMHPGTSLFVKENVKAYHEFSLLDFFFTTFLLKDKGFLKSITSIHSTVKKKISSRIFSEIPAEKIRTLMLPEMFRLLSSKILNEKITDRIWEWAEHAFDKWVAIKLNSDIIHAYEHSCLNTFKKATTKGIFKVYEQPSAHHLFVSEKVINPLMKSEGYFHDTYKDLYDSPLSQKRNKRRDEEISLSDLIICNSSYVKKTLMHGGVDENKVCVLPLAFPEISDTNIEQKKKLSFVVSGNLSYLKGTHHVLRIWKKFKHDFSDHELILIGTDMLDKTEWKGLPENVKKISRLPHADYINMMQNADVLLFNTYSDGFGMVMTEAMAKGLAVIATSRSAAPDLIEDGTNGLIIKSGDEDSLYHAMMKLINHPEKTFQMRMNARNTASKYQWNDYRKNLTELVVDHYSKQ